MPGLRPDSVVRQMRADVCPGYVRAVVPVDAEDDHLARLLQERQCVRERASRLAGAVPGDHDGRRSGVARAGVGPDQHGAAPAEHDAVRQSVDGASVIGVGLADDGDVGVVRVRGDGLHGVSRHEAPLARHLSLRRAFGEHVLGLLGEPALFRIQPLQDLGRNLAADEAGNAAF